MAQGFLPSTGFTTGTASQGFAPQYGGGTNFFAPLSPTSGGGGQFSFGNTGFNANTDTNLKNVETRSGTAYQMPVNVIDVRQPLQQALNQYTSAATNLQRAPQVTLGQNFAGPDAFDSALRGGIDYFGRLGISEGQQNLALQRNAENARLMNTLGRDPANSALISVLQNQNLIRSQLAGNPLISDAQKGTAERVAERLNLQNTLVQLRNQAMLDQAAFNQQAKLASLQPQQNLLELLSNLQGQARGVNAGETQVGARNYK